MCIDEEHWCNEREEVSKFLAVTPSWMIKIINGTTPMKCSEAVADLKHAGLRHVCNKP